MAVLASIVRGDITAEQQRVSTCPGTITKAQLRASVDALDDWWETTGAALANAAFPQPQRSSLTTLQKYEIFMRVLKKKVEGL